MFRVAIITLSDSDFIAEKPNKSGKIIEEIVNSLGYEVVYSMLLPDDKDVLERELADLCDGNVADLILTTGGTGFSKRDNTPDATMAVVENPTPGISSLLRYYYSKLNPNTMLVRVASGIRKSSLIVNLPSCPNDVRECLEYIMPSLYHRLEILRDEKVG